MVNNNITKALIIIALLLCSSLSYAIRPEPGFSTAVIPSQTQQEVGFEAEHGEVTVDENCEGVGEEECLMRRTLAAHTDYIYTQKHKP